MDTVRRKIPADKMTEELIELSVTSKTNEIKDTILRIKIDDNYDRNVKTLNGTDVNILKDTLAH